MPTFAHHAAGAFAVDSWEPETLDDADGWSIQRVRLGKTFTGDMAGTSTVDMISAVIDEVPTAYVGIERLSATLDGRTGRFLLQHAAPSGDLPIRLTVVPGSGRGGLIGLRGDFRITVTDDGAHSYAFDYEVD